MSRVIEAKVWKRDDGRTASVYGACPWTSPGEKPRWSMVYVGYTVLHPDGTTGTGREPWGSREAAQAWCDANPKFPGMSQG